VHRGLDLGDLGFHDLGLAVALAVVLVQDLEGLLTAILGNEPTGALGDEALVFMLVPSNSSSFRRGIITR
jgi:hypothetical protein